jgi:two-component system phosphate regulon sensor histidine kinase PhoR
MFGGVLPFVFLIAAAAVLLAILFSWYLTAHFIDPIRAMADHPLELRAPEAYPELQPLLDTIKDQQKDVISAARMRQEFTANVSHELKTPLAFHFRLCGTDRNRYCFAEGYGAVRKRDP